MWGQGISGRESTVIWAGARTELPARRVINFLRVGWRGRGEEWPENKVRVGQEDIGEDAQSALGRRCLAEERARKLHPEKVG